MLRLIFTALIVLHGLIHLMGFTKEWQLAPMSQLSGKTLIPLAGLLAKFVGVLWLIAAVLLIIAGVQFFFHKSIWWLAAMAGMMLSQLLIILYWKDARAGTIANLIMLIPVLAAWGEGRFERQIQAETTQLFAAIPHTRPQVITEAQLSPLPYPVQNWLRHAGVPGHAPVRSVRLRQHGWMRTKPEQDKWMEAFADQYFTSDKPGFVWAVNMQMMPLIHLTGRDKFEHGKGFMNIKALSLYHVVDSKNDPKVDQGTLQRFLGEIVLFPSAALNPYINWLPVDSTHVIAAMEYEGTRAEAIFEFDANGDFVRFTTDRYMGSGAEATLEKWQINATECRNLNGFRIPVKFEVCWKLKAGDFTWFKMEITEIEYDIPEIYPVSSISKT